MPLSDDGDLVRAYGFVAIYFAALENSIADCLRKAEPLLQNVSDQDLNSILRWRFSDQVTILRDLFCWAKTNGPTFVNKDSQLIEAEDALSECLKAAKDRNDTLHSPIIANLRTESVIRHSNSGYHTVLPRDVYRLANHIDDLFGAVGYMQFTLNSLLGRHRLS